MSPDNFNLIVKLGDLSKPVDTLIKKASNAVGGLFAERVAKAETAADLIRAQSKIEITDLYRRAAQRGIEEEVQHQKRMEDITAKALPQLNENANPDSIENDWLINFFDKCRIVSDNEMQELWSRVLAGEANAPGTYSKRTVNFLSDLDKDEANLFTKLCGFVWVLRGVHDLVMFDERAEIYNRHGIDFDSLIHLDSISLIQFGATEMTWEDIPKRFSVTYYDRPLTLEMPRDGGNELVFGMAKLTRTGQELAPICRSEPVEGFWEYVTDQWKNYLPKTGRSDG